MRNENKKIRKQTDKQQRTTGNNKSKQKTHTPGGSGLIGEHDLGDVVERQATRTVHTKNAITGSDSDGQSS